MHYAYFVLVTTTCFFFLFLFSPLLPSLIFFFLFQSMNNSHKANVVRLFTCIFLNYAYTGMVFFIPIPPFSTLVSKNSVLEEDRHNRWQRSAFGNSMRACLARCFDQRATVIVVVHLFMEKRKKRGIFCEIIRSKLNRVITTFTPISKIASLRFFFIFF